MILLSNPPPLWNFLGLWPPHPPGISNSLRGGGLDIFWNHTIKNDDFSLSCCAMSFRSHYVWRGVFDKFFPRSWGSRTYERTCHGKVPLWKIKYEQHFIYLRICSIKSQSDVHVWIHLVNKTKYKNNFNFGHKEFVFSGILLMEVHLYTIYCLWQRSCSQVSHTQW